MITTEAFYAAFKDAGMLRTATWTPSAGGPLQTGDVRFRTAERDALTGEQRSTDYTMRYPASLFPGLKRGETVVIDGPTGREVADRASYTLRENPGKLIDGSELEALLAKVS